MIDLIEDQDKLNIKHCENPEVGDYWNDMLVPILVVIGVTPTEVIICKKTKYVGPDRWTWDLTQIKRLSKEEFSSSLKYGGQSEFSNRFHCIVRPGAQKWVRKEAVELVFGKDNTQEKNNIQERK